MWRSFLLSSQKISLGFLGVSWKQDQVSLNSMQRPLLPSSGQFFSLVGHVEKGEGLIKAKLV